MGEVTIGLAAYNAASTLPAAIASLRSQTYENYRVIISDNASTDGSAEICAGWAADDPRVTWLQTPKTVPVGENYRNLLLAANTPYFMWAAADDLWAPEFLARTIAILETDPGCVCSQSQVIFLANGRPNKLALSTGPLTASPAENLRRFLNDPAGNCRFYGVFRTEALQQCFPEPTVYAFDWLVSALSLRFGSHRQVDDVLMARDETPSERYAAAVAAYTSDPIERALPLLPFTLALRRESGLAKTVAITATLVWLNVRMAGRFWTLHLYNSLRKGSPTRLQTRLASLLAPGLRDRLRDTRETPGKERPKLRAWKLPEAPALERTPTHSIVLVLTGQLLSSLQSLDHVATHLCGQDLECDVGIVDHGTSDATELVLRQQPGLRYMRCGNSVSFTEAVALGTAAARSDKVIVLCDDVMPDAATIRSLLADVAPGEPVIVATGDAGPNVRTLHFGRSARPLNDDASERV